MPMNICPWCDAIFSSVIQKPRRCPSCKREIEHYEDMQPNDPSEPDESKGWGDPEKEHLEKEKKDLAWKREARRKFDLSSKAGN